MAYTVDILLATYNGARYLDELLVSLDKQDFTNWRLLVRDDGSTDTTGEILERYSRDNPGRVKLLTDEEQRLGPSINFSRLISFSDAPYIVFCDQDDIWLDNKISLSLAAIHKIEQQVDQDVPVLVHSDLKVTDHELNVVAASFWKFQNISPERGETLKRLLVQNVITGNTVIINAALREQIKSIPAEAIMHDWWIGLVASAMGKIGRINEPTILYRQHALNDTGAKQWGFSYIINKIKRLKDVRRSLYRTVEQAGAFLEEKHDMLTGFQRETVSTYANLLKYSYINRKLIIIRYGFFKHGVIRTIGMLLII